MSYEHAKMLEHLFMQRCLDSASRNLGIRSGKLSYTVGLFKNKYKGTYFTHYHKLYLYGKLVGNLYGNDVYNPAEMENLVLEKSKKVCVLKRIKNKKQVKYHKL